jgi:hypothetical protein
VTFARILRFLACKGESEMTDRTPLEHGLLNQAGSNDSVPAARPLDDFSMERIGPDVVLFDLELNRYHTLNDVAFDIWRQCDGRQSTELIGNSVGAHREVVETAIELLDEGGLLLAPESSFKSTMHRRRMVKLVAAGVIGAVGVPVVASISRLGPEASATGTCGPNCIPDRENCCCCHTNNPNCDCSNRASCESNQQKYCVN